MGYSFGPVHYDDDSVDVVVGLLSERNPVERAIELDMVLKKLKVCPKEDTVGQAVQRRVPMLAKKLRRVALMTPAMEVILAEFCVEVGIARD